MKNPATTGVIDKYLDARGLYDPRKSEKRKLEILHLKSLVYKEKLVRELFRPKTNL